MLYRLFLFVLCGASVAGILAGVNLARAQGERPPAPKPLNEPARSPYTVSVAATGIIEAERENVSVATSRAGLVTAVHAGVGQVVKQGDPLFQLDERTATAQIATLEAQIAVQQAALEADQVQLEEAADQWDRVNQNGAGKFLSDDEKNRRKFALAAAKSAAARTEAMLAAAKVQRDGAMVEKEVLTVRASRDGTVLRVNVRAGEYANVNPQEPLMVLGDVDVLQVRADVDEQNAPQVRPGSAAQAFLKGDTKDPLALEFVRIDPFVVPKRSLTGESTERVDTRVLQVIFRLQRPEGRPLYVGQQVDIYIEGESLPVASASAGAP